MRQARGSIGGLGGQGRADACRRDGDIEYPVHMPVFCHREHGDFAARRAGQHDRNFQFQRQEFFQHAGRELPLRQGRLKFGTIADARLALAVVTEARRLQHRRQFDIGQGRVDVRGATNHRERSDRKTMRLEKTFFRAAVLRHRDCIAAGADGSALGQFDQHFGRGVFEFGGDGRTGGGHLFERNRVGVGGVQMAAGELGRRRQRIRVQHRHPVVHIACSHGKHAAELAAADQAEGGAGQDHGCWCRITGFPATAWR